MADSANSSADEARGAEFVRLLTVHQPDIYVYLRSLVLDPDEASEILQDTNLVLWEKRDQFEIGTNFRAWAFQIARYKLLQHKPGVSEGAYAFPTPWSTSWCCTLRPRKRPPNGSTTCAAALPRCRRGTGN